MLLQDNSNNVEINKKCTILICIVLYRFAVKRKPNRDLGKPISSTTTDDAPVHRL